MSHGRKPEDRQDLDDVARLLEAFEQSDWQSVHIRVGDLEVSLSVDADAPVSAPPSTTAAPTATAAPPVTAPVAAPPAGTALPAHDLDGEPDAGPRDSAPAAAPAGAAAPGGTPVLAPSPGIFWRSPSPGAPPFVDVGQQVDADTTVCIVELMKLMNHVLAGVTGSVSAVLVGNGELVEMGQPILLVRES